MMMGRTRLAGAFTLLELAAVLAIMALAAAAVFVTGSGWFTSIPIRDAVERLTVADRLARQHAARSGRPVVLAFDLDHSTVSRIEPESPSQQRSHRVRLARGFAIQRVMTAYQRTTSGRVNIPCSGNGHTPTYALLVGGPDGQKRWVLVAGLTGQFKTVDDERDVQNLLGKLAP